ncbi:unnamed protein product [Gongylonema pulchrum]|uniref:Uncharacterized protein n=1 Tax=Gongylonema pulchrum TaxID=637853 RepID=A0A183EKX1_9BILA|nr:unnamed protein product [Gongylonema pulchrum]
MSTRKSGSSSANSHVRIDSYRGPTFVDVALPSSFRSISPADAPKSPIISSNSSPGAHQLPTRCYSAKRCCTSTGRIYLTISYVRTIDEADNIPCLFGPKLAIVNVYSRVRFLNPSSSSKQ